MAEMIQNGQNNYGWNLTWQPTGKFPIIAERIYETLAAAQEYVNNPNSSACKGVVLSVVNDEDNNGLYQVLSYATAEVSTGTLNKIGSNTSFMLEKVIEGLPANIKEAYQLVDAKGNPYGVQIPVYKDSSLQGVTIVTKDANGVIEGEDGYDATTGIKQYMRFTYLTTEGSENVVDLDVSQFLVEAEFDQEKGLAVNNGVVSVKLSSDADAESYLQYGTDGGLKIVRLSAAIAEAKAAGTTAQESVKAINDQLGTTEDTASSTGTIYARIKNLEALIEDVTGGVDSIEGQINDAISSHYTDVVVPELEKKVDAETGKSLVSDELITKLESIEQVTASYNESTYTLTFTGISDTL